MTENVADRFVRKYINTPVTIFLMNGVKLKGKMTEFDDRSIILVLDGNEQLIERNAVSSIMPGTKQ